MLTQGLQGWLSSSRVWSTVDVHVHVPASPAECITECPEERKTGKPKRQEVHLQPWNEVIYIRPLLITSSEQPADRLCSRAEEGPYAVENFYLSQLGQPKGIESCL